MADVDGICEDGYGPVADAFRANFEERDELGAACSIMRDGEVVVDLWGGHRDRKRSKPWQRDTLVTCFSTTKGMSAAAMAVAHSRGLFELDQPVSAYWPEFGQAGKENVTVSQLLRHEAGLAVIDKKLRMADVGDFEKLGAILAAQKPGWSPGTGRGYHAMTLGWYESQLLSRVDPEGRTIGKFFADEVADQLDVEFYIGLPEDLDQQERIAQFYGGGKFSQLFHLRDIPAPVLKALMNPFSPTAKAFMNPRALTKMADINKRELLYVELPSVNGTGTARAVAAVYGDLATGGESLGVGAATCQAIEAPVEPQLDHIFRIESAFNFGFMKQFPLLPFGSSPRAYGHTGLGGSFGYADPDTGIGYAYLMNQGGFHVPIDPRDSALRAALEKCL